MVAKKIRKSVLWFGASCHHQSDVETKIVVLATLKKKELPGGRSRASDKRDYGRLFFIYVLLLLLFSLLLWTAIHLLIANSRKLLESVNVDYWTMFPLGGKAVVAMSYDYCKIQEPLSSEPRTSMVRVMGFALNSAAQNCTAYSAIWLIGWYEDSDSEWYFSKQPLS